MLGSTRKIGRTSRRRKPSLLREKLVVVGAGIVGACALVAFLGTGFAFITFIVLLVIKLTGLATIGWLWVFTPAWGIVVVTVGVLPITGAVIIIHHIYLRIRFWQSEKS